MLERSLIAKIVSNISIKTKLILLILVLVLYSIIIIGYFGYTSYAKIFTDKFIDYSYENSKEIVSQLDQSIENLNAFSLQTHYNDFIYDAFMHYKVNDEDDTISDRNFNISFEQHLRSILLSRTECDAILFRFSINNKSYFVSKNYSKYIYSSVPIDRIYEKARANHQMPLWYVHHLPDRLADVYLARMVYDRNSREEIGVFVYKINTVHLFELFKDYASNKSQNIVIYDTDNSELFAYNSFQGNYAESQAYLLKPGFNPGVYASQLKGDKIYMICNMSRAANWKVIVSISSNILLKEVRTVLKTVVILCIITLPIWIILINFLYIDIIKPLNVLISNMRKIEKGNLGIRVETKRKDEMGFVFNTFNKMSEEIHHLINRVYKSQLAMKDAEIKALQAQINPHFLYNTLEAINWKAKINGVEEIGEMVSALSSIIEANLNRDNEHLISLSKEIEYITNYTLLVKKRFGKKIDFAIYVQPDVLNSKIPKLIIQPLIENAVYHGLEMKKGGGTVKLDINRKDNLLLVQVEDDGVGIEEKKLYKLRKSLNENDESVILEQENSRTKIGILNVHRRLELLYGKGYGLEIESIYGAGTVITVKIPFETDRESEAYVQSTDY